MKSLTVVATTEQAASRFRMALLRSAIPVDDLTHDVDRGLASVSLPEEYDVDRLAKCLAAVNLEIYEPEAVPEVARKSLWAYLDSICPRVGR